MAGGKASAHPEFRVPNLQDGTADSTRDQYKPQLVFKEPWNVQDRRYARIHKNDKTKGVMFELKLSTDDLQQLRLGQALTSSPPLLRLPSINGTPLQFPLHCLASSTSDRLSSLPEATSPSADSGDSTALLGLREDIATFTNIHMNGDYGPKALQLYSRYLQSGKFDSRLFVQSIDGYYVADFQIACVHLACTLKDGAFAFLAKCEMFHAWLDIQGKMSCIKLRHFQQVFVLMPFSDDFLAEFHHQASSPRGHGEIADQGSYNQSVQKVHPVSWALVSDYHRDIGPMSVILPKVSYQRTLDTQPIIADGVGHDDSLFIPEDQPARDAAEQPGRRKKQFLPNSHIFHHPDPHNPRPGDDHLHVFIQRDFKNDFPYHK